MPRKQKYTQRHYRQLAQVLADEREAHGRVITLLSAYGNAKFGDEWWPGNAAEWLPPEDAAELEKLLEASAPDAEGPAEPMTNDFTLELQAQPFGWRAQELAGDGPAPVVIQNAVKIDANRRPTGIWAELAIIPARDSHPAVLVITDQESGHGVAYELPGQLTLIPAEHDEDMP